MLLKKRAKQISPAIIKIKVSILFILYRHAKRDAAKSNQYINGPVMQHSYAFAKSRKFFMKVTGNKKPFRFGRVIIKMKWFY